MSSMHEDNYPPGFSALLVLGWAIAVGFGVYRFVDYQSRPGDPGRPVTEWPPQSQIVRDTSRPNVVVWLHPRCPCSDATLDEVHSVDTQSKELRPPPVSPDGLLRNEAEHVVGS